MYLLKFESLENIVGTPWAAGNIQEGDSMAAEYQLDLDKYYSVDKTPEQDIGQQGDIQEVQYLYTVLGTDCFGLLDSLARY